MHDAELSNTQSLTLGRNPRRRTTVDVTSSGGSRYATAPRHSSLESRHSSMTHQQSSPSATHGSTGKSAAMNTLPGKSPRYDLHQQLFAGVHLKANLFQKLLSERQTLKSRLQ
jgi:hypothetical protein